MLVEIDLLEAKRLKLTINQFLLIKLVIDNINLSTFKDTLNISNDDIDKLIRLNILTKESRYTETLSKLKITDAMNDAIKSRDYFSEFYELYPVYAIRTDGSKDYLRSDINRCRNIYTKLVGRSESKHNQIIAALRSELTDKRISNKMGYMKRMYKWLTSEEYLVYNEKEKDTSADKINKPIYGSEVI